MSDVRTAATTKKEDLGEKKQTYRHYGRKSEDNAKKDGIPMLRYGKGNNYHKFKQALSEVALKEFGNLGKLINLGRYYVPVFSQPSLPPGMTLSSKQQESLEIEMIKEYNKQVENRPKLYGLIRQHMSLESKDEVAKEPDFEVWHANTDPEKLWQAIEKTHKIDSTSNVDEVKSMAARKAYQNIKQGSFESLAQYSERFRETYRAFQDSSINKLPVEEADQAMDFFYGLDNAKYGIFKTNMINGWTTGAFKPPATVNEIYRIAGNWVKPTSKLEGGTSATYVTIEEHATIKRRKEQNEKNKAKGAAEQKESEQGGKENKKDRTQLECWYCNEKGHFSSKCPKKKKDKEAKEKEGLAHATWQEEMEGNMFCTLCEYTVNNAVNVRYCLIIKQISVLYTQHCWRMYVLRRRR
jgi:hypothetical protein